MDVELYIARTKVGSTGAYIIYIYAVYYSQLMSVVCVVFVAQLTKACTAQRKTAESQAVLLRFSQCLFTSV